MAEKKKVRNQLMVDDDASRVIKAKNMIHFNTNKLLSINVALDRYQKDIEMDFFSCLFFSLSLSLM